MPHRVPADRGTPLSHAALKFQDHGADTSVARRKTITTCPCPPTLEAPSPPQTLSNSAHARPRPFEKTGRVLPIEVDRAPLRGAHRRFHGDVLTIVGWRWIHAWWTKGLHRCAC